MTLEYIWDIRAMHEPKLDRNTDSCDISSGRALSLGVLSLRARMLPFLCPCQVRLQIFRVPLLFLPLPFRGHVRRCAQRPEKKKRSAAGLVHTRALLLHSREKCDGQVIDAQPIENFEPRYPVIDIEWITPAKTCGRSVFLDPERSRT